MRECNGTIELSMHHDVKRIREMASIVMENVERLCPIQPEPFIEASPSIRAHDMKNAMEAFEQMKWSMYELERRNNAIKRLGGLNA